MDCVKLYDYENKKFIKINSDGKNFPFISHNGELYFIYRMKPFILCKLDISNGSKTIICNDNSVGNDNSYRGGTSGYYLSPNKYYGFGHRTYYNNNKLFCSY